MANDKAVASASILMRIKNSELNKSFAEARKQWQGLRETAQSNAKSIAGTAYEFQAASAGFGKLSGAANSVAVCLRKMAPVLGIVGAGMSALGATVKVVAVGIKTAITGIFSALASLYSTLSRFFKNAITAAIDFEKEYTKLQTIAGSNVAEELSDFIRELYPSTTVSRDVFMNAAGSLAKVGYSINDIKTMLQSMGDAAELSVGDTNSAMSSLAATFSKVGARGYMTSREINSMLSMGIDITHALASHLGTDVSGAMDAVSKKQIDMNTAMNAFIQYMGQYYGAMQQQSNTTGGSIDTIKAQIQDLMVDIGQAFLPTIAGILNKVQAFFTVLKQHMPEVKAFLQEILSAISEIANAIIDILEKIAGFFGKQKLFQPLRDAFKGGLKKHGLDPDALAKEFYQALDKQTNNQKRYSYRGNAASGSWEDLTADAEDSGSPGSKKSAADAASDSMKELERIFNLTERLMQRLVEAEEKARERVLQQYDDFGRALTGRYDNLGGLAKLLKEDADRRTTASVQRIKDIQERTRMEHEVQREALQRETNDLLQSIADNTSAMVGDSEYQRLEDIPLY